MTVLDIAAALWFVLLWAGFSQSTSGTHRLGRTSLSQIMNAHRRTWMKTAVRRDLRMIDTAILGGLQNGTAFFASTTIFAIGGCFALLGATDEVLTVVNSLPFPIVATRIGFELKVFGLIAIFAYAFFKFGWSYRLFNYSSILFGAIPMVDAIEGGDAAVDIAGDRAAAMNILAGKHFNAGLRAIFLAIGYLGWFAGPLYFMGTTTLVILVLVRRQFMSAARRAALEGMET